MRVIIALLLAVFLYADSIKNYNVEVTITPNGANFVYDFDYYLDTCCISFYSALKDIENLRIEGDVTEYKRYNLKNFLGIEIQNRRKGWHHYRISYFVDASKFYYPLIQWKEKIEDLHLFIQSYKPFMVITPNKRYLSKDNELSLDLFNIQREYLVISEGKSEQKSHEEILDYHIVASINDRGELEVSEEITYLFPKPKHGIYRYIPLRDNQIELKEVLVDSRVATYKSWIQNRNLYIKIGDPNALIKGVHHYKIVYIIKYLINRFDEKRNVIYFNAIGKGWKVPIKKASIDLYVTPRIERFDIISSLTPHYLNEHHIIFKKEHLYPNEGLSFKVVFDKNYFDVDVLKSHTTPALIFFIVASLFIYLFYRRYYASKPFSITPHYYPPKLNVLRTGLVMDGIADYMDLSSAILELAVRGYLKIVITKKWFFKKVSLVKLKESEGLEYELKLLFRFLFSEGKHFDMSKANRKRAREWRRVEESSAKYLYNWGVNEGYFSIDPRRLRREFVTKVTLALAPFHLLAAYEFYRLMPEMIEVAIFLTIFVIGYFFQFTFVLERFAKGKFIIYLGMLLGIIFPSLIAGSLTSLSIVDTLFLVAALFVPNICSYTQKGEEMRRYIVGFKEFVKRVEKEKVARLLEEDPNYLDRVVPYASLFGYLKRWERLYEDFNMKMKNYEGSMTTLHSFSATPYGSSSGGGSSSSSGSGGGGGGSW